MEKQNPSEFYYACRNNEIEIVRRLLEEHSVEELDQMEPNGSTGLHAACFYKNDRIVQLLLDRGFTRRMVNKYNNTPYKEASTDLIRDLFPRPKSSGRFGGLVSSEHEKLIWIFMDDHNQHLHQYVSEDTYDGDRLEYGLFHCAKILEALGMNMSKMDVIRRLFRRAVEEKDATRLIQAYTAETDFYKEINNHLLFQKISSDNIISEFIDTISLNRQLHEKYQYIGHCYRSIRVQSSSELNFYKIGAKIINRCFLSTTKDRQFAEEYVRVDHEDRTQEYQVPVLFLFEIRQKRTALDIEHLSEFPNEKEVLILINKIFKVIRVTSKLNSIVEIELRESKSTRVDKKK